MPGELPDRILIDEILPPKGKVASASSSEPSTLSSLPGTESEVARFLAKWLDNWLRIPGTNFKIGLDPLLALFPGVGSSVASGGGLVILVEAIRCGVSIPVLVRMSGNMLINTLFDFLPLGGPVVSAFFKSNLRNLRLLQAWQAGRQREVRRSTFRMFLALAFFLCLMVGLLFALFAFYVWLLRQTGLFN